MCRSKIDFNSDLKSSFVKMSDLNLTIRFFSFSMTKKLDFVQYQAWRLQSRGWWKSEITWSWGWIYHIKNVIKFHEELEEGLSLVLVLIFMIFCGNQRTEIYKSSHIRISEKENLKVIIFLWFWMNDLSWIISLWAEWLFSR